MGSLTAVVVADVFRPMCPDRNLPRGLPEAASSAHDGVGVLLLGSSFDFGVLSVLGSGGETLAGALAQGVIVLSYPSRLWWAPSSTTLSASEMRDLELTMTVTHLGEGAPAPAVAP